MNSLNSVSSPVSQTEIYTDLSSLAQLRAKATSTSATDKKQAAHEVAKQFESLFLQMMLKSMRDASPAGEAGAANTGSQQTRFYQDMFDKQIALDLSQRQSGGIGLAATLERQLNGISRQQTPRHPLTDFRLTTHRGPVQQTAPGSKINTISAFRPQTAEQFVQALWPHARRVAAKLGVAPQVLIAQAALETGWGQKMMADKAGQATNNLFGIKAGVNWSGKSVNVSTLEYRNGVATKQQASFRAYPSVADSFDDYVQFLQNSPRYRPALTSSNDNTAYLQHLQQAGYSTDPMYADKIHAIMQRESFIQAVSRMKKDAGDNPSDTLTNTRGIN